MGHDELEETLDVVSEALGPGAPSWSSRVVHTCFFIRTHHF